MTGITRWMRLVVAAITNSQLQRLTEAFKEAERLGLARDFRGLPEPWPGFRAQAEAVYRDIFVSRAEVHRARGKAHDATIKQVRDIDGASGRLRTQGHREADRG